MSRRKCTPEDECCTERLYGGAWWSRRCLNRAKFDIGKKCGMHSVDGKAARKERLNAYRREKSKVREAQNACYDARHAREEARVELVDAVDKMLGKPGSFWCGDRNRLTALVGRCRE